MSKSLLTIAAFPLSFLPALASASDCPGALQAVAAKSYSAPLSKPELLALCQALKKQEVSYSGARKQFVDAAGGDVQVFEVKAQDLNGDGVNEVFVHLGSTYLGGARGDMLWLFVRGAAKGSAYRANLGFSTESYAPLAARHGGFPDIQVDPRVTCGAIWRWNGKAYAHLCNQPRSPNGCLEGPPICPAAGQ